MRHWTTSRISLPPEAGDEEHPGVHDGLSDPGRWRGMERQGPDRPLAVVCARTSVGSWPAGTRPSPLTSWWTCSFGWITCWLPADVQIGSCRFHPPAPPLRYPWSWEVLRSWRPEEVPSRVPSVVAEVTLPVGVGLVPLGVEAAARAFWCQPR